MSRHTKKYIKKNKKQKGSGFFNWLRKKKYSRSNKNSSFSNTKTANTKKNNYYMEYEVTRFQYKGWKDSTTPDNNFNHFITILLYDIIMHGGNTYIHCSAGVGRTGTLYVILKLLLESNITIAKVINEINSLREHRNNLMVQTIEQFQFIFNFFGLKINQDTLKKVYDGLKKDEPKKKCETQNRYENVQQFSKFIPLLENQCIMYKNNKSLINNKSYCQFCYINAAELELFKINNKFSKVFVGQCPIEASTNNFYKMLYHNQITRIIMVTDFVENGKKKCDEYLPTNNNKFIETNLNYSNEQNKNIKISFLNTNNFNDEIIISKYNFKVENKTKNF